MTEMMMRGGLSSDFSSREEVAKNITYIDANNLYGGIMLQYPLPLKDFELIESISLDEML